MTDWREQYLAALDARDEIERANADLYDYCTRLADEKAALQKQIAEKPEPSAPPPPPPPLIGYGIPRFSSPPVVQDSTIISQLRSDLSKAQQEREILQSKLDRTSRDYESLQSRTQTDSRRIATLTTNVAQLTVKVRDKEEELKGKAKLVENVQDENVTLNLQLNVAEENAEKLRRENQELVDRWMALKSDQAEKMNQHGRFD